MNVYFTVSELGTEPARAHLNDAGWDLYASRGVVIAQRDLVMIHTDIQIALPEGHFGYLLGRSSSMRKYGLLVIPSVIDQGYRGEIIIQVMNFDTEMRAVQVGDRIAQLLILPVPAVDWVRVNKLPGGDRGENGFGSSGR